MGAVTSALAPVFGSATGESRALLDWDAGVRTPLPLCRRIGFVQLAAGSGTSTVAAAVATALAGRRRGMVLAVDASPSPYGLLPRLGLPPGPAPAGEIRAAATTAAEARAGLGRAAGGCHALDLRPGGDWPVAVGPIARFYDIVLTDWGLRHPGRPGDLDPVLTSSHAVCLVVRAEPGAVAAAAALLPALTGRPGTPPVLVALVAVDPGTRPGRLTRALPVPVVPVGHDPGVTAGRPRRPYRTSCLRLAADLLRSARGRLP